MPDFIVTPIKVDTLTSPLIEKMWLRICQEESIDSHIRPPRLKPSIVLLYGTTKNGGLICDHIMVLSLSKKTISYILAITAGVAIPVQKWLANLQSCCSCRAKSMEQREYFFIVDRMIYPSLFDSPTRLGRLVTPSFRSWKRCKPPYIG